MVAESVASAPINILLDAAYPIAVLAVAPEVTDDCSSPSIYNFEVKPSYVPVNKCQPEVNSDKFLID